MVMWCSVVWCGGCSVVWCGVVVWFGCALVVQWSSSGDDIW